MRPRPLHYDGLARSWVVLWRMPGDRFPWAVKARNQRGAARIVRRLLPDGPLYVEVRHVLWGRWRAWAWHGDRVAYHARRNWWDRAGQHRERNIHRDLPVAALERL